MCGRATVVDPEGIEQRFYGFSKRFIAPDWKPRYNLNPREDIPVVHIDPESGERALRAMHWNLVPGNLGTREQIEAFDAQYSTFNAKIERVATAPTFRGAWRKQRGLVVVDGIIEWVGAKGAKIPHWIRKRDGGSFAMAGLWSVWRGKTEGDELWSCTIVIGQSDRWYLPFHHRMAYLLAPEMYDRWLDPELTNPDDVRKLIDEHPFSFDEEMEAVPISKRINNPRYDAPDCLELAGAL
jgi:putative SOS response-associated peptidase YedK